MQNLVQVYLFQLDKYLSRVNIKDTRTTLLDIFLEFLVSTLKKYSLSGLINSNTDSTIFTLVNVFDQLYFKFDGKTNGKDKNSKIWFQLKYIPSNSKTTSNTRYESSIHSSFMNNSPSKTMMTRPRLGNPFLKSRSTEDKSASINKETIVYIFLKTKTDFYSNFHHKRIAVKKRFLEINTRKKIILKKDDQIASDFHNLFINNFLIWILLNTKTVQLTPTLC